MSEIDSDLQERAANSKDTSNRDNEERYQGFDAAATQNIRKLARTFTRESLQGSLNEEGSYRSMVDAGSSFSGSLSDARSSSAGLKRYLTNMSQVPGVSPFNESTLPLDTLNPYSDDFDAKLWVKNLRKLYDSDPEYYQPSKMGIAYRDLRAYGIATSADFQPTVSNGLFKYALNALRSIRKPDPSVYFDILKPMDAIMRPGELTVVLGRPGSGCSTLLKSIASHTFGYHVGEESRITYDGLTPKDIINHYRGDVIYSAETDVHFPHLSVGDTLNFAARLRTPQNRGEGVDRESYARHMASVYMATYGLSHTRNTNVGNDIIRGVSGGERKRVSIAEASLSGANIQCWDNATRGLDSATALEFIRALKTSATIAEITPLIAIYQCSQDSYDLFDNVILLYEGRQIFFGKATSAKEYFVNMGWECPHRQTTADFLTSLTSPAERVVRPGFESLVPSSAIEFEEFWKKSPEYASLIKDIDSHFDDVTRETSKKEILHEAHVARQSKHISPKSPYTVSFFMQVRYIMHRNVLRTKGSPSIAAFTIFTQLILGLVLSSIFYNLASTTGSFYYRGASLFFAVLSNAFGSLLEIMSLFEARPIVEKHKKYALYRPSADALASIITELPVKLCSSIAFNFTFYFMVNFRRNPGNFFFYWLMAALCTLVMSHLFRSIGAVSTSLAGAMTPATVLLIAMVIFAGFVIPTPNMLGWSRWINYINPVAYVFENMMTNEFHQREFACSSFVPAGPYYASIASDSDEHICSVVGAIPGQVSVNGSRYLQLSFQYYDSHKWRNFGIVVAFTFFFLFVYIGLCELNHGAMQKGEIALFLKSDIKKLNKLQKKGRPGVPDIETGGVDEKAGLSDLVKADQNDPESSTASDDKVDLPAVEQTFHWRNLTYSVKVKSEGDRILLNHVDGWVKPGQLTALMGSSGAGKTTLLNCLSDRVNFGVISDGIRMVNGNSLDSSFQRSIGYVQQQDLHLPSSTVREAFRFSAQLRQPQSVSRKEKNEYVEYIIDLLEMNAYADALVGVAGEGLNVEQRKRLTIGVELVAKPKLLLFLDEPTSGLDSQTAWSICKLMRKLSDHGQAILCTIHQPSALLLKEFDRLLFLQSGGQTVYFGDLGENCSTLINYFEKQGAEPCPPEANPAEWMLEVVGAAPGSHAKQDYHEVWNNSDEYKQIQASLSTMETELVKLPREDTPDSHKTYASPLWKQYILVTQRVLVQNWRTPSYIYSKGFLCISSALFNGFSFFKADLSLQGLQNQMFSTFMFTSQFATLIQQMLPYYIRHREIYEVREAPSRTFSWFAFITAQIASEVPFQIAAGTISFFCWYYPVGLYQNATVTDSVDSRGVLVWLYITAFFIYTSSMGHFCISFVEEAQNAANGAILLFTMFLNFCGVLAGPSVMPGFWIFMYRANPFTYWIQGILATGLSNAEVTCGSTELLIVQPFAGQTCEIYMAQYMALAGGYLTNPTATSECSFCKLSSTNEFLSTINSSFDDRWRDFGLFIVFIAFNMISATFLYWVARVPHGSRQKKSKT